MMGSFTLAKTGAGVWNLIITLKMNYLLYYEEAINDEK